MMNIPKELLDNDLVFHFTKPYVAMESILHKNRIRFSSLVDMNDPYEYKIVSTGVSAGGGISEKMALEAMLRLRDTILYKSKILSLVKSKNITINNPYQLVFTKPRLWAQYAEAQYGVCLVFGLSAFLDEIKNMYPKLSVYHDYVEYDLSKHEINSKANIRNYDKSLSCEANIKTHIGINKKDVYFRKYEDFEDESEYRIVLINWEDNGKHDIYIDITGIIRGVILGERFHAMYEETVKDIVINKLHAKLYRIIYNASHVVLKQYA
ncbi:MAG: DUF2971 domain-containing protein [Candidatus Brocadia sp.]|nr:DUF2971 domain-containing protein [Candidatus Brocadia sp.]